MGPHAAAHGLKFYAGSMFPAEYRKQLFIIHHGSWNRSAQVSHTGHRIMVAKVQGSKVVGYLPAIWHDPRTMAALRWSGGLGEVFTWPLIPVPTCVADRTVLQWRQCRTRMRRRCGSAP
jgi:hypothetical protein